MGPTPARKAYTGAPFKVNRQYAEKFGDEWVILSAKYGFISPNYIIPEAYNVTFKKKYTNPVKVTTLKQQIKDQNLNRFKKAIGLGGKEYRKMIEESFSNYPVKLIFPFAGLPLGFAMQATKKALTNSKSLEIKKLDRKGEISIRSNWSGYFINIDPAGNFIHKDNCFEFKKMDPTKDEGEIYHSEEKYEDIILYFKDIKNIQLRDCHKCNPPKKFLSSIFSFTHFAYLDAKNLRSRNNMVIKVRRYAFLSRMRF
ncbi:MAG: DUF6884 domain-containing protein [Candidatus Hodarchaeales archaeon]|jgi:hypothetical protein